MNEIILELASLRIELSIYEMPGEGIVLRMMRDDMLEMQRMRSIAELRDARVDLITSTLFEMLTALRKL